MAAVIARAAASKKNRSLEQLRDASTKQLDAQDVVLLQGQITKRGSKENDTFLSRWVVVRPMCITYSKFENTKVIDRIEMDELIGIASRDDNLDEGDAAQPSQGPEGTGPGQNGKATSAAGTRGAAETSSARNVVFWRFKSEMREERKCAFSYSLGPTDLALFTSPIGFHRGRKFVFRVEDRETREKWKETISRELEKRRERPVLKTTTFFNIRKRVRSTYVGDHVQIGVAALIGGNFMLNICQAQVGDENEHANTIFESVDLGFTIIFTIELLVNMFATLLWEFVGDAWNWFDFVVVAVSLISLVLTDLPGADVLRLMRCFRVFRLFKRIPSLRKIMGAITKSLVPMGNAFCIVCLVTAIYSIVAVTFFASHAPHNFSSFFVSFFSLFQSMTGDNWSTDCRDLMAETGQGAMVGIFYVSFMLLVSLVLLNVVIAVLLDAFGKAASDEPAPLVLDTVEQDDQDQATSDRCPFERIAKNLCFGGDLAELEFQIERLWEVIVTKGQINKFLSNDHEMSYQEFSLLKSVLRAWRYGEPKNWIVNCVEFQRGVRLLPDYMPPVIISRDQYAKHVIPFCNHRGFVGGKGFRGLMKTALRRYQLRELYRAQKQVMDDGGWEQKSVRAMVLGTVGLLREDMESHRAGISANRTKAKLLGRNCGTGKPPDPLNQMVCLAFCVSPCSECNFCCKGLGFGDRSMCV